jgi:predicted butyrate kinase (DUF1464 family)
MRVIGIDPGSKSFDIFGIEINKDKTYQIFIDTSLNTKRVMQSPETLIEILESQKPFDYLIAPSGFGLPIKAVKDLDDNDLFEIILRKKDSKPSMGLQKLLQLLKTKEWNAYIIPGVKHLPTVANFRKINKIDLGTADKVCATVVGIKDLMEETKLPSKEINFIMIELGYAFSAIVSVENGKIIDGLGGSNILGFRACGSLDGELAYLMTDISKKKIYHGGIASIVGYEELNAEEIFLMAQKDKQSAMALDAFVDSLVKGVYSQYSTFKIKKNLHTILLSGRLASNPLLIKLLSDKLSEIAPVRTMKSYSNISKRAAQGAAFIAEGLLGGPSKEIIENLQLTEAKGHILDLIYVDID